MCQFLSASATVPVKHAVEDWFLGYLQYVCWCTNVWLMFMHVDVTIGYMTFLPSNWIYIWYCLCESQSSPHKSRKLLFLPRETLIS